MHLVLKFWFGGRFVAEKQTYVLNLMAGHLLNMTYNENDKWNVWELDHYTDRSSLGIHFWDLYWKMAYLKFERFWYSNVRPWETVQIWGDCPCISPILIVMCTVQYGATSGNSSILHYDVHNPHVPDIWIKRLSLIADMRVVSTKRLGALITANVILH